MKDINYIIIRVFAKPEDDSEIIEKALINLLPKETKFNKKKASSFKERTIIVYEANIEKQKLIKEFLKKIFTNLNSEQKELLIKQIEYRLNENKFNIRLEKKDLIQNKHFITNYGDCFNIIIGLANFPDKTVEERVKDLIDNFK